MANSDIKIHYFDEAGRAEVSRLILVLAGKSFDDVRFTYKEWPDVKPNMPFGQVPVLEVDGKKFDQGVAIAAYLAREFGFYGKTNLDSLKIDMIAQLVYYDFRYKAAQYYYGNDGKNNPEIGKTITAEHAPQYLAHLQRLLTENGGEFMVGNSLTLADVIVFDMVTGFFGEFVEPAAANYPLLKDYVNKIGSIEKIKNYYASKKH